MAPHRGTPFLPAVCIILALLAAHVHGVESADPKPAASPAAGSPNKEGSDSAVKAQLDTAKAEADKLKVDLQAAQAEIEELKANAKKAAETADADKSARDEEKSKATEKAAAQEAAIAKLTTEKEQISNEKAKLAEDTNAQIAQLTAEKEKESSEKSKHAEDIKTMTSKMADLESKVKSETEAHQKTKTDLGEVQTKLQQAQKETEQAKSESAESKKQAQQKFDKLQQDRDSIAAERDRQKQTIDGLEKEHTSLHSEHKTLQSQYADPSVQHFLRAKAIKMYKDPGIEGAANKTFVYVIPSLNQRYATGKQLLNYSQTLVHTKLNAYIGSQKVDPWLPAISGSLVYGLVFIPFFCTLCCLTRVVCKLRPLLLFCHLDFLLTTLCAGGFSLYTEREPMAAFAHHDAAVYLFTQVIFGTGFILYLLLLCLGWCRSRAGTYEGWFRLCQLMGATPVIALYYRYVWTPAMVDQMPRMDTIVSFFVGEGSVKKYEWMPYFVASAVFLVLLRLERLCWYAAGGNADKKAQQENQMAVTMRDDLELANIIGELSDPWGEETAPLKMSRD